MRGIFLVYLKTIASQSEQVEGLLTPGQLNTRHPKGYDFATTPQGRARRRRCETQGQEAIRQDGLHTCFSKTGKSAKGGRPMPRLSKRQRTEWAFFIHPKTRRRTYNKVCRRCLRSCKQSFRATLVSCPRYNPRAKSKGAE